MQLQVTQEDIDRGIPKISACPIARALKRQGYWFAWVGYGAVIALGWGKLLFKNPVWGVANFATNFDSWKRGERWAHTPRPQVISLV